MNHPVAVLGSLHVCPVHSGGPVLDAGQSGVTIDGLPVAVAGGTCLCGSSGEDGMALGSARVRIDGMAVMRVGDATAHGGAIASGMAHVKFC
jgi:uncharacterized Zn-binding protein involved in type VI secretion